MCAGGRYGRREHKEMRRCDTCGNEIAAAAAECPFCGAQLTMSAPVKHGAGVRVVNLEKGMPTVEQALEQLRRELQLTDVHGCRVMVLIHGYGSSGRGGAIKKEIRRQVAWLKEQGRINDFMPGEECGKRSGHGRHLLRRFPFLAGYLQRPNPGITLVVV